MKFYTKISHQMRSLCEGKALKTKGSDSNLKENSISL